MTSETEKITSNYRSSAVICSADNGIKESTAGVLKKNFKNFAKLTRQQLCWSQSLFKKRCRRQAFKFIEKGTTTQVFSGEFCKIFNNTYFEEHLPMADSVVEERFYTEQIIYRFVVYFAPHIALNVNLCKF